MVEVKQRFLVSFKDAIFVAAGVVEWQTRRTQNAFKGPLIINKLWIYMETIREYKRQFSIVLNIFFHQIFTRKVDNI
jgi:hypothetical protein